MNLFLFGNFTLFVYKSLIVVVEDFQKYQKIQREKTQPVVVPTAAYRSNLASVNFIQTAKISNIFSINRFLGASYHILLYASLTK